MKNEEEEIELSEEEAVFLYRLFKTIESAWDMPLCQLAGYNAHTEISQSLKEKVYRFIRSRGAEWMQSKGCNWW